MGNLAVCGGAERKEADGDGSGKPGKFTPPTTPAANDESKNEPKGLENFMDE